MMCPYGRRVMAMPKAYRDRGTKIFIFAGREAWRCAKTYLGAGEPKHALERYVVVAPAEVDDRDTQQLRPFQPLNCSWPVADLPVLVIDCGMDERLREQLVVAIKRDGAASGELMGYPAAADMADIDFKVYGDHATFANEQIQSHQTWYLAAAFDDEAARRQDLFDFENLVGYIAWNLKRLEPMGSLRELCQAGRLGRAGELALARVPQAGAA